MRNAVINTYQKNFIAYALLFMLANCCTIQKADGHRLTEIISNKNMLRFYKKYPKLRNEDIWNHIRTYDNKDYLVGSVGLLNDSVAHQYTLAPGIFEEAKYPLQVIAPYLSNEARGLVTKR